MVEDVPVFLLSVDGVHCRVYEPKHPTKSKDKSYFSHKFNQSGLNYELGISVYDNALIWLNGPFKASSHDIAVYRAPEGLKSKLPPNARVIADRGYASKKEVATLSTPNLEDTKAIRKFKRRVRARHESFNAKIKTFRSLSENFRHGIEKHQVVFEAICIICQNN